MTALEELRRAREARRELLRTRDEAVLRSRELCAIAAMTIIESEQAIRRARALLAELRASRRPASVPETV